MSASHRTSRQRHAQSGFSLLEVLIAVVVLSIGLLGMAGLQVNAMKNNHSSLQRTQAVMLSYYMLDALRANRSDAAAGTYDIAKTCTVPAAGTSLATNEQRFWLQALKDNLGNLDSTCGDIDCSEDLCTVRIYWNDERATGGSANQTFSTSTRL